jgi:hypothetical protein
MALADPPDRLRCGFYVKRDMFKMAFPVDPIQRVHYSSSS